MEIATRLSNEIASYLDLNTRQIQIATSNMANIDTPGYRAIGMDFQAEMRKAMAGVDEAGESAPTENSGVQSLNIFNVDGLVMRPDGNNVSIDRESLSLAEAQLKFKTGVALLKHEYTRLSDAIHADAK